MPEIRIDPLTGLRAIVADRRADRPGALPDWEPVPPVDPAEDPFAEGHEASTPPELFALRPDGSRPNTPGWRVRVVPNRYPALEPNAESPAPSGTRHRPELESPA